MGFSTTVALIFFYVFTVLAGVSVGFASNVNRGCATISVLLAVQFMIRASVALALNDHAESQKESAITPPPETNTAANPSHSR